MSTKRTAISIRWFAATVMAAGLGTAIVTGGAVASADTAATNTGTPASISGTSTGPVNDAISGRKLQEQVGVKKPKPTTTTTGPSILDDWEAPNV